MPFRLAKNRRKRRTISSRTEVASLFQVSPHFIAHVLADKSRHYGYFELPKPNGTVRPIEPPRGKLKTLQRRVLAYCYRCLRIPDYLHGGLPRRSIVTHASQHVGKHMVGTLDIRSFYPSTHDFQISPVLEEAGFIEEANSDLMELLTLRGTLPQGAPTSCLMANLAFVGIDHRIRKMCGRIGLYYTRFVDDMAISGNLDFKSHNGSIVQIVRSAGYEVAKEKTRFQPQGTRQVVTGLIVNEKLRPTREFITELKHEIHLCRREGPTILAEAEGVSVLKIKSRLRGRVAHVAQSDAKLGKKLRGLLFSIPWSQEPSESER